MFDFLKRKKEPAEVYTEINAKTFDSWAEEGWIWSRPIDHETYQKAEAGDWNVLLTPTKPVPKDWFPAMKGAKVLGLASGGGQQMPIFAALGADCTVLDYSKKQLESEKMVAKREGYSIEIIRADMTKPLPFADETFDLIFHPVSNCYVEELDPIWKECYRILKKGGMLLVGFDNGVSYAFNEAEDKMIFKLPFNPLKDPKLYDMAIHENWGVQFSHTIEEEVGGQLRAGFRLLDIYQDTSGDGNLHDHGVPTFFATKAIKE